MYNYTTIFPIIQPALRGNFPPRKISQFFMHPLDTLFIRLFLSDALGRSKNLKIFPKTAEILYELYKCHKPEPMNSPFPQGMWVDFTQFFKVLKSIEDFCLVVVRLAPW
jgi:hypothetical protein